MIGVDHHPIVLAARERSLVVDIHAHLGVPEADAMVREAGQWTPPMPFTEPATEQVNGKLFAAIGHRLCGTAQRIEDMDAAGIDVQVISPNPGHYHYGVEADLGRATARLVNDRLAEAVAQAPDRLVGLGTVPLQDASMAVAEMRRCVRDLGFRGLEIGTFVAGKELSDPSLSPFFAAAEELDVLLFVHPLGFTQGERMTRYYLNNIIGNPLESTLALSHLILGGTLDHYPRLKLCVAHGGGFLPAYWGRLDHAWKMREDSSARCDCMPSSYLKQIWLDTLVFDRDQLASLVANHPIDRLCMRTDWPFDMGEADPVGFHSRLDPVSRSRILGENAIELLFGPA